MTKPNKKIIIPVDWESLFIISLGVVGTLLVIGVFLKFRVLIALGELGLALLVFTATVTCAIAGIKRLTKK